MKNPTFLSEILNKIDRLSTTDKTQLVIQLADLIKQELTIQDLNPRKSLRELWHGFDVTDGLIVCAKYLDRIANLKPENANLFKEFEQATENLLFYSETEHDFDTFVWEVNRRGDFYLADFLKDMEFIKKIAENEFLNLIKASDIYIDGFDLEDIHSKVATPEQIEIFRHIQHSQIKLLELLKAQTEELEIFRFEIWDDSHPLKYEVVDFVIAQTNDKDWLGIIPLLDGMSSYFKYNDFPWIRGNIISLPEDINIKQSSLELKSEIQQIFSKSKLQTISAYCKETTNEFILEIAPNKNLLIAKLLQNSGLVKATTFEDFSDYHYNCTDKGENARLIRYQNLDNLLKSKLKNIREYVIGGMAIYSLYTIGETNTGDYPGVSTMAVHT